MKSLQAFPAGLVPDRARRAGHIPKALWLAHRTGKKQQAVFSFRFFAPGPARAGGVVIASAAGPEGEAVTSAIVTVNQREVGRVDYSALRFHGSAQVALEPPDLNAFRYGVNTVGLRVTRQALPKGVTACNTRNDRRHDRRHVGIAVGLHASFAARAPARSRCCRSRRG